MRAGDRSSDSPPSSDTIAFQVPSMFYTQIGKPCHAFSTMTISTSSYYWPEDDIVRLPSVQFLCRLMATLNMPAGGTIFIMAEW